MAAKPVCPHLQRSFNAAVDAPFAINDKACAADHASPLIKSAPVLVIEVLSPSTAACDRGEPLGEACGTGGRSGNAGKAASTSAAGRGSATSLGTGEFSGTFELREMLRK